MSEGFHDIEHRTAQAERMRQLRENRDRFKMEDKLRRKALWRARRARFEGNLAKTLAGKHGVPLVYGWSVFLALSSLVLGVMVGRLV